MKPRPVLWALSAAQLKPDEQRFSKIVAMNFLVQRAANP